MSLFAFREKLKKLISLIPKPKVPSLLDTYFGGLKFISMMFLVAVGLFLFGLALSLLWTLTIVPYAIMSFQRPNVITDYLDNLWGTYIQKVEHED